MNAPGTPLPPPIDFAYLCRAISEASLNPMAAVDGTEHIVRHVNPAFCELAGKSKEQLLGRPFPCMPAGEECMTMLERVYQTSKSETHTGRVAWSSTPSSGLTPCPRS